MKCSAILMYVSSFPHEASPLSQHGVRPSGDEVISKDVSARSASAECSDAEKVAHVVCAPQKVKYSSKVLRTCVKWREGAF
eukprot:2899104-Alexandrium_andersonii.AAC.1